MADGMDLLSLALKLLTAVSTLGGIVSLLMSYYGVSFNTLPPEHLKPLGLGFIGFALFIGLAEFAYERDRSSREATPSISVLGNQGPVNVAGRDLIIQPGDSPKEKEEKRARTKRLLAGEAAFNLRKLDNRLGLVHATVRSDDFEEKLADTRRRVAPAMAEANAQGYGRLIAAQQVASLRHALNSERLRSDVPDPLLQPLQETDVPPEPVQSFYEQVAEVERDTESLLQTMDDLGRRDPATNDERAHNQERIEFGLALLTNRTRMAHLAGLRLLGALGPEAWQRVADEVTQLRHLEPRSPLDEDAYSARLLPLVQEGESLLKERRRLLAQAELHRDAALEQLRQVDEALRVKPTDQWFEVVGKARAARELGRTTDAVAAFARYGDMFAATDSTAAQYAHTAQQFTLQLGELGVKGGVYIHQVVEDGAGDRAGLQLGDILVSYAGRPVPGTAEFTEALGAAPQGEPIRIDFLRMTTDGRFQRGSVTVPGGPVGVGLMPI